MERAAAPPRAAAGPLLRLALAAGTAAAAWAAGWFVVREPAAIRLDLLAGPREVAALAVGAALALAVLRHPGLGLALLAGAVYLNLSEVLVRFHGLPSVLQLLFLPVALAAVAGGGSHAATWRGRRLLAHPVTLALGAYLLVVLASTTVALEARLADERLAEGAKALAIFLLAAQLASTAGRVEAAVRTLTVAGVFLAVLGLLQFATGDFGNTFGGLARVKQQAHIAGGVFEPRIAGPLGDPNFFAQALLLVVPLALFAAWEARTPRARWAALAAAGVVMAAIVLTYSRGGALALACVLGLALLARRVRWRDVGVGAALLLLLAALAPREFAGRLTTLAEIVPGGEEETLHPDSSFVERKLFALVAWEMFLDHPLLGVGAGNYTTHFGRYAEEVGSAARQYEAEQSHYPHNLYLEIAAETGIAGLAAFGVAVVACFVALARARRRFEAAGEAHLAGLAQAFAIGLAGYLVSSLFLHGHFQRYLWLLFAFAAALGLNAKDPEVSR